MKNMRPDIVIAICALIVSGLATAASFWQSQVVARQLSAQVWPYLAISTEFGANGFDYAVSNKGLGPAIVRSFVVTVDRKPQKNAILAINALLGHVTSTTDDSPSLALTSILPDDVLSAGQTVSLVRIDSRAYARKFQEIDRTRLDIYVCYCTIEDACFEKTLARPAPHQLHSCPVETDELQRPSPLGDQLNESHSAKPPHRNRTARAA